MNEYGADSHVRSERASLHTPEGLQILVALDMDVLRLGLCSLLGDMGSADLVEGCRSIDRAVETLRSSVPYDFVICSSGIPDDQLRRLVDAIKSSPAPAKLVLLLGSSGRISVLAAQAADGFLQESQLTRSVLAKTMRRLQDGESLIPTEIARELVSSVSSGERVRRAEVYLTPRERQVVSLLAEGKSNRQIASSLAISEHGAKRHVANVMAKLNSRNRTLAVAEALRLGLIDIAV